MFSTYKDSGTVVWNRLTDGKSWTVNHVTNKDDLVLIDLDVFIPYLVTLHPEEIKQVKRGAQFVKKDDNTLQLNQYVKKMLLNPPTIIQLHNIHSGKTKTLRMVDTVRMIFCDANGILMITSEKFFKINYEGFGIEKPREVGSGERNPFPLHVLKDFTKYRDSRLLLSSRKQFQLWNIETGEVLTQGSLPREANTFICLDFYNDIVVGTTTSDLYIWRVGFPGMVLGTYLSITCLRASSEGFFMGNLAGEIIFINPKTNITEFLSVNEHSSDIAKEGFASQLETRLNDLLVVKDVVFTAQQTGAVSVWNKSETNQTAAKQSFNVTGIPSSFHRHMDSVFIHVRNSGAINDVGRARDSGDDSDEIHCWIPPPALISAQPTGRISGKIGKEMTIDGVLLVKMKSERKWKSRYFQLWKNILYMFRGKTSAAVGSYILNKVSAIRETPPPFSNTSAIPTSTPVSDLSGREFTLMINLDEYMYLCAHTKSEAQRWVDALQQAIEQEQSWYAWEIDFFEIDFSVDEHKKRIRIEKTKGSEVCIGYYNFQEVSVKIYHTGQNREDFQTRVNLLSALKHPCILDLIGVVTKDHLAIVQPFMKMGTLKRWLHSENPANSTNSPTTSTSSTSLFTSYFTPSLWTWHLYLKIASDIASAMNYLHTFSLNNLQKPILHKKLTTAALMLNSLDFHAETNVFVTDFGLARLVSPEQEEDVAFIAPEIFTRGYKWTIESDIFSFGMVLWEMVTRENPFNDESNDTIISNIALGVRPVIPTRVPPDLEILIRDCWHGDPATRPSFAQIAERLNDIAAHLISTNTDNQFVINYRKGLSETKTRTITNTGSYSDLSSQDAMNKAVSSKTTPVESPEKKKYIENIFSATFWATKSNQRTFVHFSVFKEWISVIRVNKWQRWYRKDSSYACNNSIFNITSTLVSCTVHTDD